MLRSIAGESVEGHGYDLALTRLRGARPNVDVTVLTQRLSVDKSLAKVMMELFPVVSPHRNRHSGSSNHGKLLIFQGNVRNLLIQVNYWHRTNK